MNDIDKYLEFTHKTAVYPKAMSMGVEEGMYLALGLVGESGEVAEKLKKFYRDGTIDKDKVSKELGDVAWYWVRLCMWAGYQPSEVLEINTDKLSKRLMNNTIHGNGDDR